MAVTVYPSLSLSQLILKIKTYLSHPLWIPTVSYRTSPAKAPPHCEMNPLPPSSWFGDITAGRVDLGTRYLAPVSPGTVARKR